MEGRKYPNSGAMFNNDKRKPTSPDFTGRVETTCPHCHTETQWNVSSWLKQGRAGKFFSLNFRVRDEQAQVIVAEGGEGFPWET